MPVRLIATDLDGTFFGDDHRPAPRTVAATNAARDAGIHMVAITGRSHFSGIELARSTGARLQWFIGSNGGHRVNLETEVMEERLLFPAEEVARLRADLAAALGDVGFGWEMPQTVVYDRRFVELSPVSISGDERVAAPPPHPTEEVGKVFVGHPEVTTIELVDMVAPHVGPESTVTTSGAPFVEITPAGADKGSALARLCGLLGIEASEVVAFGDNQNDLTMLQWAGRGVAMGNALPQVKAIADGITESNVDHGVAVVIEALLSGIR